MGGGGPSLPGTGFLQRRGFAGLLVPVDVTVRPTTGFFFLSQNGIYSMIWKHSRKVVSPEGPVKGSREIKQAT